MNFITPPTCCSPSRSAVTLQHWHIWVLWCELHNPCAAVVESLSCAVKPCSPAACLGLCFPGALCLLYGKDNPGCWGNSNIPHYLSSSAGNCPPPKAFCMTCFVCFALGLLSSGNNLAVQGVFYLDQCTASSPAVGPSCHQWASSVWHPGCPPKEKNSTLISKPD